MLQFHHPLDEAAVPWVDYHPVHQGEHEDRRHFSMGLQTGRHANLGEVTKKCYMLPHAVIRLPPWHSTWVRLFSSKNLMPEQRNSKTPAGTEECWFDDCDRYSPAPDKNLLISPVADQVKKFVG